METSILSDNTSISYTYNEEAETTDVLYFIGDYYNCNWELNKAQKLYKQEDGSYKAQIIAYDLKNGWKITRNNWSESWGTPINDGVMTNNNGGNVTQYGNDNNTSYLVTFNPTDGKLSMDNEEKTWKLLGDFNNYSTYGSDMIVKYDDRENEWYLVPEIGEEKVNYVEMKVGDEWIIRSQMRSLEVTPSNIEGHFEANSDNKFTVSESGKYEIRWYFNKPTQYIVVIKK